MKLALDKQVPADVIVSGWIAGSTADELTLYSEISQGGKDACSVYLLDCANDLFAFLPLISHVFTPKAYWTTALCGWRKSFSGLVL